MTHPLLDQFDPDQWPRLHGNGFVQLDMLPDPAGRRRRLHVWDPELEGLGQTVRTSIHDHRFSFHSQVIVGRQVHQEYKIVEGADFHVYTPQPSYFPGGPQTEDTKLHRAGENTYSVREGHRLEVPAGFGYHFDRYLFHDTLPTGRVATVMTVIDRDPEHDPRVLVPVREEPDNDFDREAVDKAVLWDVIQRALAEATA